MKVKKIVFLSFLILCVCVSLIAEKNVFSKDELTAYEYYKKTLIDTSHDKSYIKVEYPQLKDENQYKVNTVIKEFAENLAIDIYGEDYNNLDLDISYEVMYNKNGLLSIVFKGLGNIKNMPYPNNLLFAINIDMTNSNIISFDDIYYINDETISIIDTAFHNQLTPEKFGYTINDDEYEKIKESFSTVGSNIKQTINKNSKIYFTDKYVCVCSPTYHALGDYFVTEVGYAELEKYLKINKKPFEG